MTQSKEDIVKALETYLKRENCSRFELKAALVDMDGVLFDSMPKHARAWVDMMASLGIECDERYFYLYEGMTGVAIINQIFAQHGKPQVSREEAKQLYAIKAANFIALGEPALMPHTIDILNYLKDNDVKRVLVTGSGQQSVLDRISRDYPGIFPTDCRITAHDVEHGKPHPEPYKKGMALAGVKPCQAIVIENAPLGIKAGRAAGCFVIGVTTGPIPEKEMLEAGADLLFPSMSEFLAHLPFIVTTLKNN